MKTIKINIYEAQKLQVDCLEDSESDSYEKKCYERKSEWVG